MNSAFKRISIANIELDDLTPEQIIGKTSETIKSGTGNLFIVTLDILGSYNRLFDQVYDGCVKNADIITCDGAGLKLLSFLKYPDNIKNKISGVDLGQLLLSESDTRQYKVAFIGAKADIIEKLKNVIQKEYPGISGFFHHGYFTEAQKANVIEGLIKFSPDIVFVALGNPAQEKFIAQVTSFFKGVVFIGVGGSFDVWSKTLKRAPAIMQKLYIEWLYRLYQEPKRIKRMLNIPKYIFYVFISEGIKRLCSK
ncbi:MAG: WecB/TagA/CpsF family glycosyltransferase [Candidatus Wallbacteria bacterium]